ncbi:MAG: hypothetical protein ACRDKZ_09940 [Actinomycetota bacterium]
MSVVPERVSSSPGARRRRMLIGGALVLILLAVALYLLLGGGGGSSYDSMEELQSAVADAGVECSPRSPGTEGNEDLTFVDCSFGRLILFNDDEARDEAFEDFEGGPFVTVFGGNWAVYSGNEAPLPPTMMGPLETIAEELDGELIVPE